MWWERFRSRVVWFDIRSNWERRQQVNFYRSLHWRTASSVVCIEYDEHRALTGNGKFDAIRSMCCIRTLNAPNHVGIDFKCGSKSTILNWFASASRRLLVLPTLLHKSKATHPQSNPHVVFLVNEMMFDETVDTKESSLDFCYNGGTPTSTSTIDWHRS